MFTSQHYYVISRVLRRHYSYSNWSLLVNDFEKMFKEDNKNFKLELFRKNCIPTIINPNHKEVSILKSFTKVYNNESKGEVLYEGKDYDASVKDANEPDHDLEYHDKKCEEANNEDE